MTANRRILLNVVATYGRTLYVTAIGLFASRWVLVSLGHTDYGLVGLVGGMIGFVSFLNTLLSSSVGRFYAVAVGAANRESCKSQGIEECRRWFNTALCVHTAVPLVLVLVGYPIGVLAIEEFLAIPANRIEACIWIWRFTCLSCFIGMVNVPFQAMYTAKQEIAELTIYSFMTTTLNALFLYYMVTHPRVWLVHYAAWTCAMSVLPQLIIGLRAFIKYPECRVRVKYLFLFDRYVELAKFVFAKFWSRFSGAIAAQGQSILVNLYQGPVFNASMSVGNAVANHAASFSSSLSAAFWPAISNKAGECDIESVRRMSLLTCRFGAVMVLVFAIPLSLETVTVMRIWLVTPPPFAEWICLVVLLRAVLEKMTEGYDMAVYGLGTGVMRYSWAVGWGEISTVIVAWVCFMCGCGMWSICVGLLVAKIFIVAARLFLGRSLAEFSFWLWVKSVLWPVVLTTIICMFFGLIPKTVMPQATVMRVVLSTSACLLAFMPCVWFLFMQDSERILVKRHFLNVWRHVQ